MAKNKSLLLGFIGLIALLWVYYGQFIASADHTSFAAYGDGYKNYYTLAYYLKYDSGTHFSGMNYPYGENVIYTDNQPLTAWLLKPVTKLFPSLLNHVQLIIVGLLMLGHLLAYYIVYKILLRFSLPSIFAALFSVLIIMLSPQLVRLNGHFSLGYTFFIPLLIWWLIRLIDTEYNPKFLLYIFLLLSAGIFVHPYYFAMSAMFILSLSAVMAWRSRGLLNKTIAFSPVISVIGASILFKAYIIFTDPITDRPSSPWGFVMSRSTVADILLHPGSIIYQTIQRLLPKAKIVFHGEGAAYIGMAGILACAFYLLYILIPPFRRKLQHWGVPGISVPLFIAAIPVLLFAMAFPFSINAWFEGLLVHVPSTIKQFRAAGRFSWIFYYVMALCTAVFIYRLYINVPRKPMAIAFLSIAVALWVIDVHTFNTNNNESIAKYCTENYELRDGNDVITNLTAKGYPTDSFQAIVPIPFFLNGSEKLYIETPNAYWDMRLSNVTGLPIAGGQMSRTSIAQTFKLANLMSGPFTYKEIVTDFNDPRPLLMYVRNTQLTDAEAILVNKGKLLYENGDDKYYLLSLTAFDDSVSTTKKYLQNQFDKLVNHGSYMSFDTVNNCVVNSYNDQKVPYQAFGGGALYNANEQAWLYADTLPNATDETAYEASLWLYADSRVSSMPVIYLSQTDVAGNEIEKVETYANRSTTTHGNWVRVSIPFTMHNKANKIYVSGNGEFATYDEFIIRPLKTDVILNKEGSSNFMYNNYPIY